MEVSCMNLFLMVQIIALCSVVGVGQGRSPRHGRLNQIISRRKREAVSRFRIALPHPAPHRRVKRSDAKQQHGFHNETEFSIDLSTCGQNKSCVSTVVNRTSSLMHRGANLGQPCGFRPLTSLLPNTNRQVGEAGCAFGECEYILTYARVTPDRIQIEMAARTSGWVAVGFSSDQKMGGNSVLACVRRHQVPFSVYSRSYYNPFNHDPPADRPNSVLNLTDSSYTDGYMSCRVTRGLADSLVDLTNDWYQLYAYGPSTTDGELRQHYKIPKSSPALMSLISMHMYDLTINQSPPLTSSSICVLGLSLYLFSRFTTYSL